MHDCKPVEPMLLNVPISQRRFEVIGENEDPYFYDLVKNQLVASGKTFQYCKRPAVF